MHAAQREPTDPKRKRKKEKLQIWVESSLARRLRLAAEQAEVSPGDKVRRILDATLPPSP